MSAPPLKGIVARALASDAVSALVQPALRGVASIFMLHRFADPERGTSGHDAATLRSHLAYLRRMRYELVPLAELMERLRTRDARVGRTVAFTIDDGYADYASVGAPIFEEFDCPATVFVVSGVVDARGWYWWDRLRFALERSTRRTLSIQVDGAPVRYDWNDGREGARVARRIVDRLKLAPDAERRRMLDELPTLLDVQIPASPPPAYAAMTWDEVRACGRRLTTFGAHTMSHPILSRTDDAVAEWEIAESWRRLREETDAAIPVFCYPNGDADDVTSREPAILRTLGITAAVTSRPGYASAEQWHGAADAPFLVPRFPYGEDRTGFVQVVSGVERLKLAIRQSIPR